MGNTLRRPQHGSTPSLSKRSQSSGSGRGLGRISSGLSRLSARVGLLRGRGAEAKAQAANARHNLEQRLADAIKAKAAMNDCKQPPCSFHRLLLRFGSLQQGFAACRAAFAQLVGGEDGELSFEQLRPACGQLGYAMDDDSLAQIFQSVDVDGNNSLNSHEFIATLAILHILKGPQQGAAVDPRILSTWQTAERAFMSFASSRDGFIQKEELMALMHEPCTDQVRHSANGRGEDPIRSIAQRRFEELDSSGSGKVSFLEFLFCLENWVEDAEEEPE